MMLVEWTDGCCTCVGTHALLTPQSSSLVVAVVPHCDYCTPLCSPNLTLRLRSARRDATTRLRNTVVYSLQYLHTLFTVCISVPLLSVSMQ